MTDITFSSKTIVSASCLSTLDVHSVTVDRAVRGSLTVAGRENFKTNILDGLSSGGNEIYENGTESCRLSALAWSLQWTKAGKLAKLRKMENNETNILLLVWTSVILNRKSAKKFEPQ